MLKTLQASLQQYMNHELPDVQVGFIKGRGTRDQIELPDVQVGFIKGRGTRDQIANICWIIEKVREFQKSIYFSFIDYAKAFVWITATYLLQGHNLMYNIDSQRYEPLFNIY